MVRGQALLGRREGRVGATIGAIGTWRSLVAHLLWEQGVASSNLAVPTQDTGWAEIDGVRLVCLSRRRAADYGKAPLALLHSLGGS